MSTISHNSETLRYLCLWRFRVLFSVETRWLLLWRSPPANRRTSCSCGSRCRSTTWAGTLRKTICSRAHSANCGRARTRNLQRWVNIGVRTDTAAAAAAAAGPSFLLLISCFVVLLIIIIFSFVTSPRRKSRRKPLHRLPRSLMHDFPLHNLLRYSCPVRFSCKY
jgi:hypothetical protein